MIDWLSSDLKVTMKGAYGRFGATWLGHRRHDLQKERDGQEKLHPTDPKKLKSDADAAAKKADAAAKRAAAAAAKKKPAAAAPTAQPAAPTPMSSAGDVDWTAVAAENAALIEAQMIAKRQVEDCWLKNQIEGVKHGWMVGRREQFLYTHVPQPGLKNVDYATFKPSRVVDAADLVQIPKDLASDTDMPGVAPEVLGVLERLKQYHPGFTVGNYKGHGGGAFAPGKGVDVLGFSVDLFLSVKTDARGFWDPQAAVSFLLDLDQAARDAAAEWRVLYNDFSVAEAVNKATGKKHVVFMGADTDHGANLNWHGPAPLILHFHLDIAPNATLPIGP